MFREYDTHSCSLHSALYLRLEAARAHGSKRGLNRNSYFFGQAKQVDRVRGSVYVPVQSVNWLLKVKSTSDCDGRNWATPL
jgi:hypothetical protein